MNAYKNIDIILQLAAILFMIVGDYFEISGFLIGIVLLGAIQIISVLIHLSYRKETWISKLRIIYYWLLLLPIGGFVIALMQKPEDKYDMAGLEEMLFVLAVSIPFALFYLIICFIEKRKLSRQS